MRLNLSINDTVCEPYLCLHVRDWYLNPLVEYCGYGQPIDANTSTVIEQNISTNYTIEQNNYLALHLHLNCSSAVTEHVSVYYNYTGQPANLEIHHPEPSEIRSYIATWTQIENNFTIGPNSTANITRKWWLTFNNTATSPQYTHYWFKGQVFPEYTNSRINDTNYVWNSTGQLWASDNVSAGAPEVATAHSNNQIDWHTEIVPAGTAINETLQAGVQNAIRNNETLAINNTYEKVWNATVWTIFIPQVTIYNVTVWTNYSTYGVPDDWGFEVNVTNSSGTFNITDQVAINTTAKTLTFPQTQMSDVDYTVAAKDKTPPTIAFVVPTPDNGSAQNYDWLTINATVTDNVEVDSCRLEWNGTTNETMTKVGTGASVVCWANKTGLADGGYTFKVYANDTAKNLNVSETRTVNIDTALPIITIDSPLNQTYNNATILVNITATDPNLNTTWYDWNGTNTTYDAPVYVTFDEGGNTLYAYANDTAGNINSTNMTFTVDTIYPSIYYNPSTTTSGDYSQNWIFVNITCADLNRDTVKFSWNGTNESFDSSAGDIYWENKTGQSDGTYTFYAWCNDTAGNSNTTATRTVTLDTTPPQWSANQNSTPATYSPVTASQFNITWTDNVAVDTVWIEGNWSGAANYSMTNDTYGGAIYDYSEILPAGTYYWKSYANDTSDNWNATDTWAFTIARATSTCSLIFDKTSPQNYSTAINASCSCTNPEATATLWRNSTNVTSENNQNVVLAASTWNYTCNVSQSQNYTAAENSSLFVINKLDPSSFLHLALNGSEANLSVVYPAATNATGWSDLADNQDMNLTLRRNGSFIASGSPATEIAQLAAGLHQYVYNTSGGANYTAGSAPVRSLQVNKSASEVNITLDGFDDNITIEVHDSVNITAALVTPPTGYIEVYKNGTLINSGPAPLTNITTFNTLGEYNITAVYPETQNYTSSFETHFVIVNDTTAPNITLASPANDTNSTSQTQNFVFTATDNYFATLNCTLYINGAASGNNATTLSGVATTITNSSVPEGINTWYTGCSDGLGNTNQSETRTLTIDFTPPNITIIRPYQGEIVGFNVTLDAAITDNIVGVDSAWYTISNASGVVQSGSLTLTGPDYTDVWNSFTVEDGNYTFTVYANDTVGNLDSNSSNFAVDNTVSFIQILRPLNNSVWNANFSLNVTIENLLINESWYNITNSTGYSVQSGINTSIGSGFYAWTDTVNVDVMPTGNYTLTVFALDSVGHNQTVVSNFIIDKIAPTWSGNATYPVSGVTYSPGATYQFNVSWTDNVAVDVVRIEHNFSGFLDNYSVSSSGSEYYYDWSDLAAGSYVWRDFANDTAGNLNATDQWTYIVNRATSTCSLVFDKTSPQTYGTAINASCSCTNPEAVAHLWLNGTNVTAQNNLDVVLGAGSWNYTCNVSETQNYTATENSSLFVIEPAATILNLTAAPSWNSVYGTETTVNCSANNAEVNVSLFRNDTEVSVPDIATLAAGSYNYTCNNTATQNWTAASTSNTLTIGKAATLTRLFLNGTEGNRTYEVGSAANLTVALNVSGKTVYLDTYLPGWVLQSGTTPLENTTLLTTLGIYNITGYFLGDENYTGSSQTYWASLIDTIAPQWSANQSSIPLTYSPTTPSQFNITWTDNNVVDTVYIQGDWSGTPRNYTMTNATYGGAVYNYSAVLPAGIFHWKSYANDTGNNRNGTDTWTILMGRAISSCFLQLSPPSPQIYNTLVMASCSCTNPEAAARLWRNGTDVTSENNQFVILEAGTWDYTCNVDRTQNYTFATDSLTYVMYKDTSSINLLLNNLDSSITAGVGEPVNISASLIVPSSGLIQIYDNGALIANGTSPLSIIRTYSTAETHNITALYPATQNYTDTSETHFISVQVLTAELFTEYDKYSPNVNVTIEGYRFTPDANITLDIRNSTGGSVPGFPQNASSNSSGNFVLVWNVSSNAVGNYTIFANDTVDPTLSRSKNIEVLEPYSFVGRILAPDNSTVNSTVTLIDEFGNVTKTDDGEYNLTLNYGESYDIYVEPQNLSVIPLVIIRWIANQGSLGDILGIDDAPESASTALSFIQLVAVEPLLTNYSALNVTINHTSGSGLGVYKCAAWNFTGRDCPGEDWTKIADVINGATQTNVSLAPGDPGLGIAQIPVAPPYVPPPVRPPVVIPPPGAVCGNGICETGENYTSCPADCLPPPPVPPVLVPPKLEVEVISPAAIDMNTPRLDVHLRIMNVGNATVEGAVLNITVPRGWQTPEARSLRALGPGAVEELSVTILSRLCHEGTNSQTIKDFLSGGDFVARVLSDSASVTKNFTVILNPMDFAVAVDTLDLGSNKQTVCFIVNTINRTAKPRTEIEFGLYDERLSLVLLDYISPISISADEMFVLTKDYSIRYLPRTPTWVFSASLFDSGRLFMPGYRIGKSELKIAAR